MRQRLSVLILSFVATAAMVSPLWAAPAAESAAAQLPPTTTSAPEVAAHPGKVVKVVPIGQSAPAMQQLVVVRDAETGEMRAPNAAEWSSIAATLDPLYRSDAGLEEIYYEDGTIGMRLGDRYHSMVLTHRSADGRLVPTCTTDAQHAVDLLATPATVAAPATEEVSDVR